MVSKESVAKLKSAVSIVDFVERSGVSLRPAGVSFKGLCPFHQERTPSFVVSPEFQTYRCFGCGATGDVIHFVMNLEGIGFVDAVKYLASECGVEVDTSMDSAPAEDFSSLRECLRDSANFFLKSFRKLPAEHPAIAEVVSRGLSPAGKMLYGYAPEGGFALVKFLRERGFDEDTMISAGVARRTKNGTVRDFWQGRLMFFITDTLGRPVGFSGRKLFDSDFGGKYVNSPDSPVFKKSRVLFNFSSARKAIAREKLVFVVEGQFDVSAFVEAGVENVVASSGTAFTSEQGGILARAVGENGRAVFVFDGDSAGREAVVKVFENVPAVQEVGECVVLPDGLDPGDVLKQRGVSEFLEIMGKRSPLVDVVLDSVRSSMDLSTSEGRSGFVSKAVEYVSAISSPVLREEYEKKVALDGIVLFSTVHDLCVKKRSGNKKKKTSPAPVSFVSDDRYGDASADVCEKIGSVEEYRLGALLIHLCAKERSFVSLLKDCVSVLPKDLQVVAEELFEIPEGSPVFPEMFGSPSVVERMLSTDVCPYFDIMSGVEKRELFEFGVSCLRDRVRVAHEDDVAHNIMSVLEGATGVESCRLLERALRAEDEKFSRSF